MIQLPNIRYPGTPIPRVIFQTWKTKDLPPDMAAAVQQLKNANPGFIHELFDDADCRRFIGEHFPPEVVSAFDKLKPGAFKADLWRYCVLYIHGGVYLDIKYTPINGFSFKRLIHKETLCKDVPSQFYNGRGVYNAVMITMPGNPCLAEAIRRICNNCKNKYYGPGSLYVTGPGLLGLIVPPTFKYDLQYNHPDVVQMNGLSVLKGYFTYRKKSGNNNASTHYSVMWKNRNVYA